MTRRISKDDPNLLDVLTEVLFRGEPVIMPCDTMYGIVGIVPASEKKIRALKDRSETNPFLQLINFSLLPRVVRGKVPARLMRYWPGALTLILDAVEGGTVGVRIPDDELLQRCIERVGMPLYSTSVNKSGQPNINAIEEIVALFGSRVELIVDAGIMGQGQASTIINARSEPYVLLRQGAVRVDGIKNQTT